MLFPLSTPSLSSSLLLSSRPSRRSWRVWSRSSSGRGTTPLACWPSDRSLTSSWPAQWPASAPPPSVSAHSAVARYPGQPDSNIQHNMPPLPRVQPLWTEKQSSACEERGSILKHEVCALRGINTPRRPSPRLRKSCAYFSGFWSFVSSVQESICEVCFQSRCWNAQLMLNYTSKAL